MPMNQFLFDHQLAAMKADRSGSAEDRKEASDAMGNRAKRMANWRKLNGLSDLGWPRDERPPSREGDGVPAAPAAARANPSGTSE